MWAWGEFVILASVSIFAMSLYAFYLTSVLENAYKDLNAVNSLILLKLGNRAEFIAKDGDIQITNALGATNLDWTRQAYIDSQILLGLENAKSAEELRLEAKEKIRNVADYSKLVNSSEVIKIAGENFRKLNNTHLALENDEANTLMRLHVINITIPVLAFFAAIKEWRRSRKAKAQQENTDKPGINTHVEYHP